MVCFGGISAALCMLLQSAPVWLPAFGMALSPLSTVPVALAASISPLTGIIAFLSAGALLFTVSIQETLIFTFSTGLLGLAVGILINSRMIIRSVVSGSALFCGLNMLLFVFRISLFGPISMQFWSFMQAVLALFSFAYAVLWSDVMKLIVRRLRII